MNQRILVVEDDESIGQTVSTSLQSHGYLVQWCMDGASATTAVEATVPDLVLLDAGLPDIDGFEVCRRVRATSAMPVLFLSARDGEIDRIIGLELGADDYVTKPFSPRELVARVKAILRRGAVTGEVSAAATLLRVGDDFEVDLNRREVRRRGEIVALATREFDLLAFLTRNQGLALSRQQLLDGVWGADWYGDDRTVDVHVRQLRKKLTDDLPLATVWGIGYRLG